MFPIVVIAGGKRMKRRIWICLMLLWMYSLTACQNQPGGTAAPETGQDIGMNAATDSPQSAQETEVALGQSAQTEPDYSPVIADGYQFVEGLGISEPGQPAFYQMDLSSPAEVKNQYASARLVNAVYQDKTVSVRIILKDYSVKRLSDQEAEKRAEKEEDGYFWIDREQQIYGHSKFRELQGMIGEANNRRGESALIYGQGIADVGFSFNSGHFENSGAGYLEDGFYATTMTLTRKDARFLTKEPDGVYELKLFGFEQPLRFEFSRVPEYDALSEIPGIQEWDGNYFLTTGRKRDQQMSVMSHMYPKEGYRIGLRSAKFSLTGKDKEAELDGMIYPLTSYLLSAEYFKGIQSNGVQEGVYDAAGWTDITSAKLVCTSISMMSEEASEDLSFPVPETEEALDEQVVFADGSLSLTAIRRIDEQLTGTDENGEDVTVPAVYVTVEQDGAADEPRMRWLLALCGRDAIQNGPFHEEYHIRYGARYPETERDSGLDRWNISGYKIPYRDGDTQIPVVFQEPYYEWDETIVFPVIINEL